MKIENHRRISAKVEAFLLCGEIIRPVVSKAIKIYPIGFSFIGYLGSLRRASLEGKLGAAAAKNGWSDVVINGFVRDVAELAR